MICTLDVCNFVAIMPSANSCRHVCGVSSAERGRGYRGVLRGHGLQHRLCGRALGGGADVRPACGLVARSGARRRTAPDRGGPCATLTLVAGVDVDGVRARTPAALLAGGCGLVRERRAPERVQVAPGCRGGRCRRPPEPARLRPLPAMARGEARTASPPDRRSARRYGPRRFPVRIRYGPIRPQGRYSLQGRKQRAAPARIARIVVP